MPYYDYTCPNCHVQDERFMSIADYEKFGLNQRCPQCERVMQRIIGVPMIIGTDTQLFLSKSDDGFGNDNISRQIAIAKARKAGVSTVGKTYVPGLCGRGNIFDPSAWVSSKSEVTQRAEKLGRNVEGSIQHFTPVRDKDYAKAEAPYRVHPDVVADDVKEIVDKQYGGKATKKQVEKLFAEKIEAHSGNHK